MKKMNPMVFSNVPKPNIYLTSKFISYKMHALRHDDYQFMKRSILPTMLFQRSLPRLPIPKLDSTLNRFLAAAQPIVTDEEFVNSSTLTLEFGKGIGKHLNNILLKNDNLHKHTSYISKAWFDMYLSSRLPLPLNYNPLLVMKNDSRSQYQSQLIRATNLIVSSLRYWRSLKHNLLEPEIFHMNPQLTDTTLFKRLLSLAPEKVATYCAYVFKAYPLDMTQYKSLFGVTRIPVLKKDKLVQNDHSRHILVLRNGNMFAVNVLNDNGFIENASTILKRLQCVIQIADQIKADIPLCVLTSGNRDDWANSRNHIVKLSELNNNLLYNEVDPALFCLCLDKNSDPKFYEQSSVPLIKHMLCGEGTNRWFDKSISIIVSSDGTAGINFEHSWGDGIAVMRYFNEVYNDTINNPSINRDSHPDSFNNDEKNSIRCLKFDIDDKIRMDIFSAVEKNKINIGNLGMNIILSNDLNKALCKRNGVSPDAIMQLAFQLAYRRLYGDYVGTYESCSTAAFRHGRTETMRPCTKETKSFCDAFLQNNFSKLSKNELQKKIQMCSTVHGRMTKEAAMGQGFDRHLFALKSTAIENGIPIPEFYNSRTFEKLNNNIISTSTLSSDALLVGAFGPVVPDGFGVGYSIQKDRCGAVVTYYKHQRNGRQFIESIEESFKIIKKILE